MFSSIVLFKLPINTPQEILKNVSNFKLILSIYFGKIFTETTNNCITVPNCETFPDDYFARTTTTLSLMIVITFFTHASENFVLNQLYQHPVTNVVNLNEIDPATFTQEMLAIRHNFYKFGNLMPPQSLCVVDLDNTLIDGANNLFKFSLNLLDFLKKRFDIVVLWSHGSTGHVKFNVRRHHLQKYFHMILAAPNVNRVKNKTPGYILKEFNKTHNITKLSKTCLIDDQIPNYCNDYQKFIHINVMYINQQNYIQQIQDEIQQFLT